MCQRLGLDVVEVDVEWGEGVPVERFAEILADDKGHEIKAVLVTHNETATGVTSDVAGVRAAMDAADHPAMLFVDGVSSIASIDFRMDEWGVDIAVTGSQKGFMLPTGLAIVAVSHKALEAGKTAKLRRCYFDFADMAARQQGRLLPLHAGDHAAAGPARLGRPAARGGAGERVRAPPPPGRGGPPGCRRLGPRSSAPRSRDGTPTRFNSRALTATRAISTQLAAGIRGLHAAPAGHGGAAADELAERLPGRSLRRGRRPGPRPSRGPGLAVSRAAVRARRCWTVASVARPSTGRSCLTWNQATDARVRGPNRPSAGPGR